MFLLRMTVDAARVLQCTGELRVHQWSMPGFVRQGTDSVVSSALSHYYKNSKFLLRFCTFCRKKPIINGLMPA